MKHQLVTKAVTYRKIGAEAGATHPAGTAAAAGHSRLGFNKDSLQIESGTNAGPERVPGLNATRSGSGTSIRPNVVPQLGQFGDECRLCRQPEGN